MKTATLIIAVGCLAAAACNSDDDQTQRTDGQAGSAPTSSGGQAGSSDPTAGGMAGSNGGAPTDGGHPAASAGASAGAGGALACEPLPDAGKGGAGGAEALSITGEYEDDWGGIHTITDAQWTQYGVFEITQFSNDGGWIVARATATDAFNPCLWSRFDFVEFQGELYFCQGTYDAESEADALSAPPADATDPTTTGCGSYSWSRLTPQ